MKTLATLCLLAIATAAQAQTGYDGIVAPAPSIFQVVITPNPDPFNDTLTSVAASSPTDIWAVGSVTIHFDGTQWKAFPAPQIGNNNTGGLRGVATLSRTNAWAVGSYTLTNAHKQGLIEKWSEN